MARGSVKDLSDAVIKIQDGTTPTANSITIAVEEGNLNFEWKRPVQNILDRGSLSQMRYADQEPVTGSFSVHFIQMLKQSVDSDPEIQEVMNWSGAASSWVSTNTDYSGVKTHTLLFEITNPDSSLQSERITFSKVTFSDFKFEEGRPDKFSCSFQAFTTAPTFTKYT
jgi:hypothetical protein